MEAVLLGFFTLILGFVGVIAITGSLVCMILACIDFFRRFK